jgi:cation:H+ antiporter
LDILKLTIGIMLLVAGGEMFVRYAANLARLVGMSSLVIGLTVVAFGTSAPEFAVGAVAAVGNHPDTGLGNIIGSNIFNILVVLGLASIITPLGVKQKLVRFDVPILIAVTLLIWLMSLNGIISPVESGVLLVLLFAYTAFTVYAARGRPDSGQNVSDPPVSHTSVGMSIVLLIIGLGVLTLGSHLTVGSAVLIAKRFGISELVIGLTAIAAGTSLPELVTSLVALRRKENDIAVGNVIGSSIFNILGVVGVMGMLGLNGVKVSEGVRTFDLPFVFAVAVICLPIFFTGYRISRKEGFVLALWYMAYFIFLALDATGHDHLASFDWIMFVIVVPPTLILLAIFSWRYWHERGGQEGEISGSQGR